MKIIDKLKDLTFRRKGYVIINRGDDKTPIFTLPIHTKGENSFIEALSDWDKSECKLLPKLKSRLASDGEIEEMDKLGIRHSEHQIVVKEFDKTDEKFYDYLKRADEISKYMPIALSIDYDYEDVDNEGNKLKFWEFFFFVDDYGKKYTLESNVDYEGMCDAIIAMDLPEGYLKLINMQINNIKTSNWTTYEEYRKDVLEKNK